MSVTKTAYDSSYYYLQRAKELYLSDWKAWKRGDEIMYHLCHWGPWDRLPKTTRDYYEDLARKES